MHKVEIRLGTTEGPLREFEVYVEKLKDGRYIETEPVQSVNSEAAPILRFLEGDERIVVVAKERKRRMVFDKDQNANTMVEDEPDNPPAPKTVAQTASSSNQSNQNTQAGVSGKVASGQSTVSPGGPATNNPQGAMSSKEVKK